MVRRIRSSAAGEGGLSDLLLSQLPTVSSVSSLNQCAPGMTGLEQPERPKALQAACASALMPASWSAYSMMPPAELAYLVTSAAVRCPLSGVSPIRILPCNMQMCEVIFKSERTRSTSLLVLTIDDIWLQSEAITWTEYTARHLRPFPCPIASSASACCFKLEYICHAQHRYVPGCISMTTTGRADEMICRCPRLLACYILPTTKLAPWPALADVCNGEHRTSLRACKGPWILNWQSSYSQICCAVQPS